MWKSTHHLKMVILWVFELLLFIIILQLWLGPTTAKKLNEIVEFWVLIERCGNLPHGKWQNLHSTPSTSSSFSSFCVKLDFIDQIMKCEFLFVKCHANTYPGTEYYLFQIPSYNGNILTSAAKELLLSTMKLKCDEMSNEQCIENCILFDVRYVCDRKMTDISIFLT